MLRLWIYQGFQYARVLHISRFWLCHDYTAFWICLNNSWLCLNKSEYAETWVNIPKSTWMAFVILCLVERMVTCFNVYTKLEAIIWSYYQTRGYFIVAGSIWFFLWIRLNIFTSKIPNFLLPLRTDVAEDRGTWIFICLLHISVLMSIFAHLNSLDIFEKWMK